MSRSHSGAFVQLRESLPAAPKCASLFNHARYDATGRLLAEYVNESLSKEYIRMYSEFAPSNRDLLAIENAPGTNEPCITCFVVSDTLGSIRIMLDNTGAAVSRHDYLPFGEEAQPDANRPAGAGFFGADGATQRFTGKERDSESGLDYFGARYYGSALGRFSSPDDGSDQHPSDPQSWNLYSYVRNNPLSDIDPDGHACTHSTGPNGESIVEDADGKGCAELRSNSVTVGAYDNAGIAMLAGLGDRFSGPNMAQFVSDAGRSTASIAWPGASAVAECVTPGGNCDELNLALAAIPLPGFSKLTIDFEHIAERHMAGGALTGGRDVFVNLDKGGVSAAIRQAYASAKTVSVQGERVLLEGTTKTGITVQMWLNKTTNVIETAYPVGKQF